MKLVDALTIVRKNSTSNGPAFRVYLATGFNPLHLTTLLTAELAQHTPMCRIEMRTGLYGDILGNLERLAKAAVETAIVVIEWSDIDPRLGIRSLGSWAPSALSDILSNAHSMRVRIKDALETAGRSVPLVVCPPLLELPPVAYTPTWQASTFDLELRSCVDSLALEVAQSRNIRVFNPKLLSGNACSASRFDIKSDLLTGFPYSVEYAGALAEILGRLVANPPGFKGIITDLDNTLWRGVLGEVGMAGLSWDLDHNSHMHGAYQQMLHALAETGVLIAAASKNDRTLVEQALQNKDLLVTPDAMFPVEAHWGSKAQSIARILKVWNIAAASVVFIDDSPMELAEAQAAHPQLECILFPTKNDEGIYNLLLHLRDLFGKDTVLAEDSIRSQSIRRSYRVRQDGQQSAFATDAFLEQAEAKLDISFAKDPLDPRPLELVNKTNQFTLNGVRHTAVSWRDYLQTTATFMAVVSYKDKYGPLGRIAVIAGSHAKTKLHINTWVMSCRAFSRRIEYRCLYELMLKYGADEVVFDFVSTDRNGPMQEFLAGLLCQQPFLGCQLSRAQFLAKVPRGVLQICEVANG